MRHFERRTVLLTPTFRVVFPQLVEPKVFAPGQKGRYSCVALFTPAKFNDKEMATWRALIAECNRVSIEAFKTSMHELDRSVYTLPFHNGEEKEQYAGFNPRVIFCTMSAYTRRPGIIAANGVTPVDPLDFYGGCYARASVNPFANVQWKSISIRLNNLQKLADGERLDGTTAEEDFRSESVVVSALNFWRD